MPTFLCKTTSVHVFNLASGEFCVQFLDLSSLDLLIHDVPSATCPSQDSIFQHVRLDLVDPHLFPMKHARGQGGLHGRVLENVREMPWLPRPTARDNGYSH
mmetsp:Transcript_24184/g.55000  ORF Transcript_24184/g.55000 Transcript_24184/m.55000 type:complete len:101 (+) Transcript_24184:666-968(+)